MITDALTFLTDSGALLEPAPLRVFELGTNSLKIHEHRSGGIETRKLAYDVGHDVYATGRISPATVRRVLAVVDEAGSGCDVAVGTAAIRDAENRADLIAPLRERMSLGVHVLSPYLEARLLARGYLETSGELPAVVVDIGGGSVQVVRLEAPGEIYWDCVPLGAVRLLHTAAAGDSIPFGALLIRSRAGSSSRIEEVVATGGTAAAIAMMQHRAIVSTPEVAELERRVRRSGPPPDLSPDRARVLLPGLVLARQLLEQIGASRLRYMSISIGRTILGRAAEWGRELKSRHHGAGARPGADAGGTTWQGSAAREPAWPSSASFLPPWRPAELGNLDA